MSSLRFLFDRCCPLRLARVIAAFDEINTVRFFALRGSGVKYILLGKGWMRMPLHQQAWRLLKTWPNVVEAVRNVRADLFEVSAGGGHKVEPIRR